MQNQHRSINVRLTIISLFTIIAAFSSLPSFGQGNNSERIDEPNGDKIYTAVEREPNFPGGGDGFKQFLAKTLKYPEAAKRQNIQGTVFLQFVVEKDGSLSGFKILRSPGGDLDDEAVRILKQSPKWAPGVEHGQPVRTLYTIPILFNLGNGQLEPPTEMELAAKPSTDPDADKIYTTVEINPTFPGGQQALNEFIAKKMQYPTLAKTNNTQGRVYIQFVVETDGSLTDMKVLRDPGSGLGNEAVRILKQSPKWTPGMLKGKVVRVQYVIPVSFSL